MITHRPRNRWTLALVMVLLSSGCGRDALYKRATEEEAAGNPYRAWTLYQEFGARYATDLRAPESYVRAGLLARRFLRDCHAAQAMFQQVLDRYAGSQPWSDRAAVFASDCPNVFPLVPKARWILGDSETGGKNARIEVTCESSAPDPEVLDATLRRTYYAGAAKFRTTELRYVKTKTELVERAQNGAGADRVVFKWPLDTGTRWSNEMSGRPAVSEVVDMDRRVKVAAGDFGRCVVVKTAVQGGGSATLDYYAPEVGLVLTSVVSGGVEHRNTELLSYAVGSPKSEEKKTKS